MCQVDEKGDDVEALLSPCNNLSQVRNVARKKPHVKSVIIDSIEPVKVLLATIFQRLSLHDNKFKIFTVASEEKLREVWRELQSIDPILEYGNVYCQASLKELTGLVAFLQHCCCSRHYCFSIKKCGDSACTICKPVRMPKESLEKLHHLPDPVPAEDGQYCSLSYMARLLLKSIAQASREKRGNRKRFPSVQVCST